MKSKIILYSVILTIILTILLSLMVNTVEAGIGKLDVSEEQILQKHSTHIFTATIINKSSVFIEGKGVITYLNLTIHKWYKKVVELPKIVVYHFGGDVKVGNVTISERCLYVWPFGVERYRIGDKVKIYAELQEKGLLYINKLIVLEKSTTSESTDPDYIYEEDGLGFATWLNIIWVDLPVTYYINEEGTPDIPGTEEFQAIINAFQTWEDDSYSYIDFTYGGITSREPGVKDGVNVVGWVPNIDGPGRVAVRTILLDWGVDRILEMDIQFDDAEDWGIGSGSWLDVQTVATHEVGHFLGLDDLYSSDNSDKVMYAYVYKGLIKRTLTLGDARGVRYLYPIVSRPVVSIVYPQSGDTVSGIVEIQADVSSLVTISSVGYRVYDSSYDTGRQLMYYDSSLGLWIGYWDSSTAPSETYYNIRVIALNEYEISSEPDQIYVYLTSSPITD